MNMFLKIVDALSSKIITCHGIHINKIHFQVGKLEILQSVT